MDLTGPDSERRGQHTGAADDWGSHLRSYRRTQLGVSRGDFAELINEQARRQHINVSCSERHIARWELGEVRKPSKTYRRLLVSIGAPDPDAEIAAGAAISNVMPDVLSDTGHLAHRSDSRGVTLLEALAAAIVGSPDILASWLPCPEPDPPHRGTRPDLDFVRSATVRMREIDQHHGGFAVAHAAAELLRASTATLDHDRGPDADQMLIACADLARLAGWAYHDLGDQQRARRYATMALVFARRAGADSLVSASTYVLGRISLIERDPRTALRMFQLGQLPAQDSASGGESARLYANEAWAHAMMGNAGRMESALARAEEEISRVGDQIDPWTRVFFTPGEFTGIQSVIYHEYALTAHGPAAERYTAAAVERARASVSASRPGRPARSVLFDNITIATAAFRLGQIDDAVSYAGAALELSSHVVSARADGRLRAMMHTATLSSPRSDVRDLCHAIGQALDAGAHTTRSAIRYELATA